jgi:hypothetical protein
MDPCQDLVKKKEAVDEAVDQYMRARGWHFEIPPVQFPSGSPSEVAELSRMLDEQRQLERELGECYSRGM